MLRIPSIHNYCNRWCERCAFQARCAYYIAQYSEIEVDWSAGLGGEQESLHPFQELNLGANEDIRKRKAAREKMGPFDPEKSALMQFQRKWQKHYHELLEFLSKEPLFLQLQEEAFLNRPEQIKLDNAGQVLNHYQSLLAPKLARALGGKHDDLSRQSPTQSDWNGSAKVVCLALKHIRTVLQDLELMDLKRPKAFANFLSETQRFIKLMYFEFPDLDRFQRPGFDDLKGNRL